MAVGDRPGSPTEGTVDMTGTTGVNPGGQGWMTRVVPGKEGDMLRTITCLPGSVDETGHTGMDTAVKGAAVQVTGPGTGMGTAMKLEVVRVLAPGTGRVIRCTIRTRLTLMKGNGIDELKEGLRRRRFFACAGR